MSLSHQHEFYVRQPSDTEARGPFTFAQLSDLAKTGGLDLNTLYFDATNEQWLPLVDSPSLAALLPKSARNLRATPTPTLQSARTSAPVSASTNAAEDRAPASFAASLLLVLLLASAIALLLPSLAILRDTNTDTLLKHPYVWLGALDLLLALGCSVFGAKIFRVIRVRAALGLGFLGVLFWLQAGIGALAAAAVASACLWMATVFTTRRALLLNTIAGLAALAALAYCLLS